MRVIARASTGTHITSLLCVKNSTHNFCLWQLWSGTLEQRKEKTKTSKLIVDHFSLTFANLLLAWMLYFHVWRQNMGKFLIWSEFYNQFGIYQHSRVFLLEPLPIILSNPEVYSEPSQIYTIECFVKIVLLKVVNFYYHLRLHLRCLTGFWICNLLLTVWENWGR